MHQKIFLLVYRLHQNVSEKVFFQTKVFLLFIEIIWFRKLLLENLNIQTAKETLLSDETTFCVASNKFSSFCRVQDS